MSILRSRDCGALALMLAVWTAPLAADDDSVERTRIERERAAVEATARDGERGCAGRFAVAACLNQVRTERRAALQRLDQQVALLDDAERKRRAAERQARIQQRQEAQAREDEQRAPPRATRAAPARAPDAAAARPDASASAPVVRRRAGDSPAAAARRAQASKERAEQAAAHREAVERRNRDKAKQRPPEPSLPIPGASAPGT